jgi:hypothetical protein
MDELIRRVRSGEVRLDPTEASGWYDYQAWSLEPLVVPDRFPEAARLLLEPRYRRHLEEMFRATLALARETHVKQLAVAAAGCAAFCRPTIWVSPGLTVEPLPTLYRRRSACYRFVRSVLEEAFGPEALTRMHRLTPEGPCDQGLADELLAMECLFRGAYRTACNELGLEADATTETGEGDAARFTAWAGHLGADKDLAEDCRMMVPVFYDLQRRQTKFWAFLGWERVTLQVQFHRPPRVRSCEPARPPEPEPTDRLSVLRRKFRKAPEPTAPPGLPDVQFSGEQHELAVPVMAEVYVEQLLNRDEFRRHCDRYGTREAILANLH